MIIYYDSGGRLFTSLFHENGQKCVRHFDYALPGKIGAHICNRRFLRSWLKHFPEVDPDDPLIIVFDTATLPFYIEKLKNMYPDKSIIFWCWNRVDDNKRDMLEQIRDIVPVWSYSPADCRKYGLKYNTQFFFDSLIPEIQQEKKEPIAADRPLKALFIGREKSSRISTMGKIFSELEDAGVLVEKYIVKPIRPNIAKRFIWEKLMPYKDVIENVKESDVLIDIYGDEKAGCSLRPMEALFFGKKLITDNLSIRDYDFYDSRNIYIWGKETRSIKDFLAEPCVPVPEEICEKYRFSSWLRRFSEDA